MVKCKSGQHEWASEEDARKCCNGYERILVIYPKASEVDVFYGWYGYKWMPLEIGDLDVVSI